MARRVLRRPLHAQRAGRHAVAGRHPRGAHRAVRARGDHRPRSASGRSSRPPRTGTRPSSRRPCRRSTAISGGRAIAGLGAGWQENEHASYGIALGSITERIDRFAEYVAVVASMLANETTTFEGAHYQLHDAPCDPRPVQAPLPILLGVRGQRRTMAIAAEHASIWNAWTSPDALGELNGVLDGHCEAQGRDPATISRTTQALLFLSTDEEWLAPHRERAGGGAPISWAPRQRSATRSAATRLRGATSSSCRASRSVSSAAARTRSRSSTTRSPGTTGGESAPRPTTSPAAGPATSCSGPLARRSLSARSRCPSG